MRCEQQCTPACDRATAHVVPGSVDTVGEHLKSSSSGFASLLSNRQLLKSTYMLDMCLSLGPLLTPPGPGSTLIMRSLCSRLHPSQAFVYQQQLHGSPEAQACWSWLSKQGHSSSERSEPDPRRSLMGLSLQAVILQQASQATIPGRAAPVRQAGQWQYRFDFTCRWQTQLSNRQRHTRRRRTAQLRLHSVRVSSCQACLQPGEACSCWPTSGSC